MMIEQEFPQEGFAFGAGEDVFAHDGEMPRCSFDEN
jgi:hypothetical protein